ncbi:cytochrome b [Bienertia sinuspersici]
MERYYCYIDHDITINPYDEVLVLLVTWDKFSYWLLRMLRKSIGSQVPIIAFIDADVHQLDLLTFLDTPPQKVSELYGCNDCADLGVGLVDVVNIKWAGVRPSDDHSPLASVQPISDYGKGGLDLIIFLLNSLLLLDSLSVS